MKYTTNRQLRTAFWQEAHYGAFGGLNVTPRRITHYSGEGKMHNTDTRVSWCNWIDALSNDGEITQDLANRVTLVV